MNCISHIFAYPSREEIDFLSAEIRDLLQKQAVSVVLPHDREREGSTPRTSWFPRRREVRCPQNVPRAPIVILSVTTIWNGSLHR